jgi:hypothetical protein
MPSRSGGGGGANLRPKSLLCKSPWESSKVGDDLFGDTIGCSFMDEEAGADDGAGQRQHCHGASRQLAWYA